MRLKFLVLTMDVAMFLSISILNSPNLALAVTHNGPSTASSSAHFGDAGNDSSGVPHSQQNPSRSQSSKPILKKSMSSSERFVRRNIRKLSGQPKGGVGSVQISDKSHIREFDQEKPTHQALSDSVPTLTKSTPSPLKRPTSEQLRRSAKNHAKVEAAYQEYTENRKQGLEPNYKENLGSKKETNPVKKRWEKVKSLVVPKNQ